MQMSWCDGSGKEVVFVGYERPRQRETTHMINKVRTTVHYRRPDCISHSRLSSAALCRLRLLLWTRLHIPHYLLWLRKCKCKCGRLDAGLFATRAYSLFG